MESYLVTVFLFLQSIQRECTCSNHLKSVCFLCTICLHEPYGNASHLTNYMPCHASFVLKNKKIPRTDDKTRIVKNMTELLMQRQVPITE